MRYIYDDGRDYIYVDDGYVYRDDTAIASAEEYGKQAADLAGSVPENLDPEKLDFKPLGVWAVYPEGSDNDSEPSMFMQLAISKEGIIGGLYQNTFFESVASIEGMLDPKSQRMAWKFADEDYPVMEAALGDVMGGSGVAKLLLHYPGGITREWLLLRISPEETAGSE